MPFKSPYKRPIKGLYASPFYPSKPVLGSASLSGEGSMSAGGHMAPGTPVQLTGEGSITATGSISGGGTTNVLYGWGNSSIGELDNGLKRYMLSMTLVSDENWDYIVGGEGLANSTILAKKAADNSLFAWGENTTGILGLGDTVLRSSPVQIGALTNWDDIISTGNGNAGAIKTDGTLWMWGSNISGKLGDGTTVNKSSPIQIGAATDWSAISCGRSHTIAIRGFILGIGGGLWAWGAGANGNLGDGTTVNKSSPIQVGALTLDWVKISAGSNINAGIKQSGALFTWGANANGALGDGTIVNKSSPVQVGTLTNWAQVSCGQSHMVAVKTDGTLWTWGQNTFGQLGDGTTVGKSLPSQIGALTDWAQVSAGQSNTVAIKTDGTLWGWGGNGSGQFNNGVQDTFTTLSSPVQIGSATNWVQCKALPSTIAAINSLGELWTSGDNFNFINYNNDYRRNSPIQVADPLNDWADVKVATVIAGGIKTDGTLWAWGSNGAGQLGNPTLSPSLIASSPVQIGALTDWAKIFIRINGSMMAIKTDNTLWAWGSNSNGVLGLGDTTNRSSPVQVGLLANWDHVALPQSGNANCVAVKTDGTLWAWGQNGSVSFGGPIGDGTTTAKSSPVQIGALTNWAKVAISGANSGSNVNTVAAIKTDGTLWTWGNGSNGLLGNGGTASSSSPVQVGALTDWSTVSLGDNHALAIKTDGTLWAWGINGAGQFGNGTTTASFSPIQIGTRTDWAKAFAGTQYSLVIDTSGQLWSCGLNDSGEQGRGSFGPAAIGTSTLTQVGLETDWLTACAGVSAAVALRQIAA